MILLPVVVQVLLALVVLTAGVWDIRTRRIPNWLTVTGLLLGVGLNTLLYGGHGLQTAGVGLGVGFGIYFVFYLLRAMGAGDVKLMAAVGAIVGWRDWFAIFILTALLGGGFALILLLSRGRLSKTLWNVGYILSELAHGRAPYLTRAELDAGHPKAIGLPHGAVIAFGSLAFLVITALWSPH